MKNSPELLETIFLFARRIREKSGVKSPIATMSMVQIQTLILLAKTKGCPMKDIAEYLHIELPSATSLVNNLVKLDLVTRKHDKEDKRFVLISLTSKGKQFLQKVKKERTKHVTKLLIALSDREKKQLLTILQKLTKYMEDSHEK